jgi:hypothetical protein
MLHSTLPPPPQSVTKNFATGPPLSRGGLNKTAVAGKETFFLKKFFKTVKVSILKFLYKYVTKIDYLLANNECQIHVTTQTIMRIECLPKFK